MTDHIIKAARECGLPISETFGPMVGACPVGDLLERFYAIAYRAGMERAAEIAEARKHITPDWQLDQHYNQACAHCAAAIGAHKEGD